MGRQSWSITLPEVVIFSCFLVSRRKVYWKFPRSWWVLLYEPLNLCLVPSYNTNCCPSLSSLKHFFFLMRKVQGNGLHFEIYSISAKPVRVTGYIWCPALVSFFPMTTPSRFVEKSLSSCECPLCLLLWVILNSYAIPHLFNRNLLKFLLISFYLLLWWPVFSLCSIKVKKFWVLSPIRGACQSLELHLLCYLTTLALWWVKESCIFIEHTVFFSCQDQSNVLLWLSTS